MKNLYKKDVKGVIRYLKAWNEGSTIFNESGQLNTDKPVIHKKIAKAKNIGKVNETTPEQQAELEVASFIKSKLDEGYFLTIEEAENSFVILPMLAQELTKNIKKVNWDNAFASPKLDGMRCLVFIKEAEVLLMSRKGKRIDNMFHIENGFAQWLKEGLVKVGDVFDGELYVHGEGFQSNMSYVKRYQEGFSERIKFNCYDVVSDGDYASRYNFISSFPETDFFSVVEAIPCSSMEDVNTHHKEFLKEGYEGTMVRHGSIGYESDKRSYSLLKFKYFIDIQLPILDIIPADQRPEWGKALFYWEGAEDDTLKAGWKMTHQQREHLLSHKEEYIGKVAELRFFEYTDAGVPRFPVMFGIRLDK